MHTYVSTFYLYYPYMYVYVVYIFVKQIFYEFYTTFILSSTFTTVVENIFANSFVAFTATVGWCWCDVGGGGFFCCCCFFIIEWL